MHKMSTLPANSTFLPVLDDLLSPDFRTQTIPGQTPQTPAETPVSVSSTKVPTFAENHIGQLIDKTGCSRISQPDSISHSQLNGAKDHSTNKGHNYQDAAMKIQRWWKSRSERCLGSDRKVDIKAERAKHSIRHNRTEGHIRHLETEVHRLKTALATERKLRSLQVEAIRSLWGQVQKVSSISSSSPSAPGDIMSQSMPNGILGGNQFKDASGTCMSMSVHGALRSENQANTETSESELRCPCTDEIKNLRESLTNEMSQLRSMIDNLKVNSNTVNSANSDNASAEESKILQQKRPLTLNLPGCSSSTAPQQENETEGKVAKEKIVGYADQIANTILEDAKDKDDKKE